MDQNKRSRCVRIGVHDEPEYATSSDKQKNGKKTIKENH